MAENKTKINYCQIEIIKDKSYIINKIYIKSKSLD